jgi:hypothetical protein
MHSKEKIEVITDCLQEMLRKGYICPSKTDITAPVILVKKKTGETRVCIDDRLLNTLVKINAYPEPLMEHLISESLRGTYFSKIDLKLA